MTQSLPGAASARVSRLLRTEACLLVPLAMMPVILRQPSSRQSVLAGAMSSAASTRIMLCIRGEDSNTLTVRARMMCPARGVQSEGLAGSGPSTITTAALSCMFQFCLCLVGDWDDELLLPPLICLG